MGRTKVEIKKIENPTNRQVTFSKRRNGLIKKSYELSTLCDVDVAVIMFSPSGRLSLFSGEKRIEEVLSRFVNLPEHERGRLNNVEFLQRTVENLKREDEMVNRVSSPTLSDQYSQIEYLQHEIQRSQYQVEDLEKRIRVFEGNPAEVTTISEAEYHEQVLEETMNRLRMQKQVLQGSTYPYVSTDPNMEVLYAQPQNGNSNGLMTGNNDPNNMFDWDSNRDANVQILSFLNANGLLPVRDHQAPALGDLLQAPLSLINGNSVHLSDHLSPCNGLSGEGNGLNEISHVQLGRVIDVNQLPPWTEITEHYLATDNDQGHPD